MGEAAIPVEAIRSAVESHPSVVEILELLTMHLAPKQILVNANVAFKKELETAEIVVSVREVEEKIKEAEPTVGMLFLETASLKTGAEKKANPKHFG